MQNCSILLSAKVFPGWRADIGKCKRYGEIVESKQWGCPEHKLQSYFDNLCQNAESLVDEETSVNLFHTITFIFCNVKERYKVKYSEIEMHSLGIELKKSSKQ